MSQPNLTPSLAYKAMYEFLRSYNSRGATEEVQIILSCMALLDDGTSADPAMQADWAEAIATVLDAEERGGYQPVLFKLMR